MTSIKLVNPNDLGSALQDALDRITELEQAGGSIPVGTVMFCMSPSGTPPNGFLVCDGTAFSAQRYGRLALYLGVATLPNLGGAFFGGWIRGSGTWGTPGQRQTTISVTTPALIQVTLIPIIKT